MAQWVARERGAAPRIIDARRPARRARRRRLRDQHGADRRPRGDAASTSSCPRAYGLRQTIADTLGVGGIFRTLRTAPHMLALGHEIAELAPQAWLLNYTNPMAALC